MILTLKGLPLYLFLKDSPQTLNPSQSKGSVSYYVSCGRMPSAFNVPTPSIETVFLRALTVTWDKQGYNWIQLGTKRDQITYLEEHFDFG